MKKSPKKWHVVTSRSMLHFVQLVAEILLTLHLQDGKAGKSLDETN